MITRGGFMVAGPGDLNGDDVNNILIVNYPNWQGKQNSYLLSFPEQVSVPPTFLPSSSPSSQPSCRPSTLPTLPVTTETPANHPSVITFPPVRVLEPGESFEPTILSVFTTKPTKAPKQSPVPSVRPSLRPTSLCPIPSLNPTRSAILADGSSGKVLETKAPPSTKIPSTIRPSFLPTRPGILSNETFQTVIIGDRVLVAGNDLPAQWRSSVLSYY
jgi:hypothetical protein